MGGDVKIGPGKGRVELLEQQMEHYWVKVLWSTQGKAAWGEVIARQGNRAG